MTERRVEGRRPERPRPQTASSAETERVLDALPDAVIVIDADRTLAWLNRAAEVLTGWSRLEAVGRPSGEVVRIIDAEGKDLWASAPLGRRLPLSKGLPEREYELARRNGEFIPVAVRCAYEKDERHVVRRVVCSLRDARARRGMDMRTVELISTVSHEIRSPLTSVKGFTKTLLDRWDRFGDDMKKEMLSAVNSDADRVTRLLGELLDVSRLEAGRLRLKPQRVDLRTIVDKVAGKMRAQTDHHRIEVRISKSVSKVFADPDKVEQVLTNLVENAIKYTDGGVIRISARTGTKHVAVNVSDQGEGIPEAHIPRLFRKFVRRERAGSPSGTGLGLYISRGLIEAHRGQLTAVSKIGVGSTFTFTLPTEVELP